MFAQLLPWITQHPDNSHIYLVNGKPVITFWGFVSAGASRDHTPLNSLSAAPSSPAAPSAPGSPPAPLLPPATADKPWWRRWWLWLLPLLLLALLLLGLRACMPDKPALPVSATQPATPSLPNVTLSGAAASVLPAAGQAPALATPLTRAQHEALPAQPIASEAASKSGTTADAAPQASPAAGQDKAVPPQAPNDSPAAQTDPLTLPEQAPDGRADFLNGDWRVRAGIQDRNTGEPLRLQYQFEQGQGHVTLKRHNGVSCQAPVGAAMSGGALLINNGAAARCSDGTSYEMPAIRCQPDANRTASCTGNYGAEQFPLTMRKP